MKVRASLLLLALAVVCIPAHTLLGRQTDMSAELSKMNYFERLGLDRTELPEITDEEVIKAGIEDAHAAAISDALPEEIPLYDEAYNTLINPDMRNRYIRVLDLKPLLTDPAALSKLRKLNYYERLGLRRAILSKIREDYLIKNIVDVAFSHAVANATPQAQNLLEQARKELFNKTTRERYNRRLDASARIAARRTRTAPQRRRRHVRRGGPGTRGYRAGRTQTSDEELERLKAGIRRRDIQRQKRKRPSKRTVRARGYRGYRSIDD